jgi:hypothetical protein
VLDRQAFDFVVVDQAVIVDAVLHGVEHLAAEVDLGAVGQVPAVRERHAEDAVAGIQQREVHRLVGLRAGMRLHVGVVGIEELLDAIQGEPLGDVDVFAAAVVALARIAFGVLVGEHAALRLQHARAAVIFRRDQLDVFLLAAVFGRDRRGQFGVVAFDAGIARTRWRGQDPPYVNGSTRCPQ